MSITAERYTAAVVSSDLGMTEHQVKHIDVILAYGLSANEMGKACLRLHTQWDGNEIRVSGNTESVERMFLRDLPKARAGLTHWLKCKGIAKAEDVAARALYTWLDSKCGKCKGSGERIVNNKALACTVCKGLKLRGLPTDDTVRDCHQYIDDCIARAANYAGKRLFA